MAFVPTPNAVVTTLSYAVSGRIVTNTLSWLGATPYDTAGLADLAGAMRDAWSELLIGMFTNVFTLTKIVAVAQDSVSAPFFELIVAADNVGTRVGTPMSLNVCMNIGLKSGSRGRSFRGMLKHPSTVTENLVTKRQWDAAPLGIVATAYADYIDAVQSTATGAPQNVVISRTQDGVPLAAGEATPITFYQGYSRVGSISRRTS